MKRIYIQWVAFFLIALASYSTVQNPFTAQYVSGLKTDQNALPVTKVMDPLYEEIKEVALEYEKAPQNAEVHKVWKSTPGYNGLKVDVKASYENMKKSKEFDSQKLVFKEIPPSVHLSDLPPNAIYRGHPDKKMVSFIINVAWGNEYIPTILETLKKHNVNATFFLEGRWVKENPDMAKMIVDAGHEVGNHSYSHPNMKTLTTSLVRQELVKTNAVIEATTGKTPTLFAPPSGSYKQEVVDIAAELNMETIMWSVDTIDWQKPTPDVLTNRVLSKIHPGALVLMHPTESTAKSLDKLITEIRAKKLRIDEVSSLLSEKRAD
ncbi:polysaccharide deacetylase family protein [Bacillus suaedaesalsae]|uniref:Polysaccharide deacetylase family protein n=1 Tax=Bacillus suaedaesalsae TaxID=2810349 RepID=A0ABS2DIR8_9BACI|nr:polysaccharide deacetylase family protein [Bacillus suaedaesalsae]MBM6618395.1 polysaccharide deacetylase family protein [Bacillus suaedaesalsae]